MAVVMAVVMRVVVMMRNSFGMMCKRVQTKAFVVLWWVLTPFSGVNAPNFCQKPRYPRGKNLLGEVDKGVGGVEFLGGGVIPKMGWLQKILLDKRGLTIPSLRMYPLMEHYGVFYCLSQIRWIGVGKKKRRRGAPKHWRTVRWMSLSI